MLAQMEFRGQLLGVESLHTACGSQGLKQQALSLTLCATLLASAGSRALAGGVQVSLPDLGAI